MRIKNLSKLLFGAVTTSTRPPRPEMVCVVKGTFAIVVDRDSAFAGRSPGGPAAELDGIPEVAQKPLRADVFGEGDDDRAGECLYASDFAHFKPNAEVLLTGSCYAPKGRPILECLARFAVGGWSKTLRVTGNRRWSGLSITEPESFTTLPLDYAHAFGGAGYAQNPVGKGLDGKELPNVEHPKGIIHTKDDRPEPGSFGPLSATWPERAGKMGKKYDKDYQKTRAPYFAEDFDWTYFNAAPADQQLQGYLKGDEEFALHNLHPAEPIVNGRLPGVRPRLLVRDKSGRTREVPLRLDTLLVDTNAQQITLTWRGLDPVGERDLSDVEFVILASERLADAQRPYKEYHALMDRFAEDPNMFLASSNVDVVEAPAAATERLDPVTAMLHDKLGKVSPQAVEAVRDAMARAGEQAKGKVDVSAKIGEMMAGIEAAPEAPPPTVPTGVGSKPRVYMREQWKKALAQIEDVKRRARAQRVALPESVVEAEAKLRDPQLLEIDPTLREPTADLPGPGADLSGQDLSGQDLSDRDLSGAKLEGAVLIGTNLRGAKLDGASLRGAMLFKADLTGASLKSADLSLANAAFAVLAEADLRGARLDDTYLQSAKLTRARLEGAQGTFTSFGEADMTGVRAAGFRGDQIELSKAKLDGADLQDASLTRAKLLNASAKGADLRRATLDQTSMMDADLSGARLDQARGQKTVWMGAKLDGACFTLAWLRGGHFTGASAKGTSFTGADLRDTRFRKAILNDANFSQSNLFGADLCEAKLDHTSFAKANLYDAKLLDAAGPNCTFEGAVLDRVLFSER